MTAAGGLVLFDGTAPANPASGYEILYFNGGLLYSLNSSGVSTPVGVGAATGVTRNTSSLPATAGTGEYTVLTGSTAAQTLTLPASTVPAGTLNTATNLASVSVTIAAGSGTTLNNLGTTGSITLAANTGVQVILIGTVWYVVDFTFEAAGGDLSGTFPNPTVTKINGTSLAGLATGLLKNTTGTGVPSIAVADTDYTTPTGTETLTNKRITRRYVTVTQSATPTINTDTTDTASITGLAQAITSMTTNLSGTPNGADQLIVEITDNGTARAITWGASFEASTVALPTTTVISTKLTTGFIWNVATSKWRCVAVA